MSATPIVDRDCFRIEIEGDVLIVVVRNCDDLPSINYHALNVIFDAMKEAIDAKGLARTGWSVIYDFSAITGYEITAAMAFPNFYRWAREHGRRKAAHILPHRDDAAGIGVIKRLILGQVAPGGADDDHYEARNRDEALAWIARATAPTAGKDRP